MLHLECATDELSRVNREIDLIEKNLSKFPSGHLNIYDENSYPKWYYVRDGKETYLSKKKLEFAKKMADKTYLLAKLKDLKSYQKALCSYLHHLKGFHSKELRIISNQHFRKLLSEFQLDDDYVNSWVSEEFTKSTEHPDALTFKCVSGNVVRSKSESLIDQVLFMHHLPFRYECRLILPSGAVYYPDFTILHPKKRRIIYYEHFGMMDDDSYARKCFSKLQNYNAAGITPGINLITTFETSAHPLDLVTVEYAVNQFFGDVE